MIRRILLAVKESILNILFFSVLIGIIYVAINFNFNIHLPSGFFASAKAMFVPAESIFLSILVASFPFVVLGDLVASIIQEFVSENLIVKWLPKQQRILPAV